MKKQYRCGSNIEFVWSRVCGLRVGDDCVLCMDELSDRGLVLNTTRMSINKISQEHGLMFMSRFTDGALKIIRIK